jgi:hypothetical protein
MTTRCGHYRKANIASMEHRLRWMSIIIKDVIVKEDNVNMPTRGWSVDEGAFAIICNIWIWTSQSDGCKNITHYVICPTTFAIMRCISTKRYPFELMGWIKSQGMWLKDGIMETSKSIQWVMEAFTPSPLSHHQNHGKRGSYYGSIWWDKIVLFIPAVFDWQLK